VLRLLGYTKFIMLATVRTTWTGDGVVITLDEYGKAGKALFEVELEDACAGQGLIDAVFASLDLAPMNSAETVAFVSSLNRVTEIQADLASVAPDALAAEILAGHRA
jgi:hypothetical protein